MCKKSYTLQVIYLTARMIYKMYSFVMNDIYREPLFTSWPTPLSGKSLKECFGIKKKLLKLEAKKGVRELSPLSYFLNFFSTSY